MPAIAHQNKILGNTSGGGSTILVTTSESTLYGQTVTLSDGTTTMSGTFSNAGECEFTGVMMVGTLTATSGTASTSINVPYFGVYSIILSLFSATITATYSGGTCTCVGNGESYTASSSPYTFTVHGAATYTITNTIDGVSKTDTVTITTDGQSESVTISFGTINVTYDNAFRGTSITCVQSGTTITKTAPSGANTMTFYPPTTGNWVISGTVSGTSYSKTANVTSLSTSVSVSLETVPDGKTTTPTDDIEKWLQCGQITGKSYTTLSQVLDDAETYERLLSDSNACDYMARSTTWASTICADADAMMRLGKYDYACDALLADSTWCTAICGSTYFEYVLDVKVPTMTSNTTPSGTVSASSNGTDAYKAFAGNGTNWIASDSTYPQYVQYVFDSPVKVYKLSMRDRTSSGNNFIKDYQYIVGGTEVFSKTEPNHNDGNYYITEIISDAPLSTTYKLNFTSTYVASSYGLGLEDIQFYGRHTAQTDIIVTAHGGDTVYYMENGSPVTLTTADRDTGIGTVDWSDLPKGAITLYSSTAKNPSDLTADYSKTVYVTEYTTQIYLMPDDYILYWYGYKGADLEECTSANGWSFTTYTMSAPTFNTADITLHGGNNECKGVGTKSAISFSEIDVILKISGTFSGTDTNVIGGYSAKSALASEAGNIAGRGTISSTSLTLIQSTTAQSSKYVSAFSAGNPSSTLVISAILYKKGAS